MRVAMYYNNNDIRIVEIPKPEIGEGELLVKAMASGICGSDVMEWYRIKKAPRVLGHEMAGMVAEVSDGVPFQVGDRVFVSHHVPCDNCEYCRKGYHTACETLHKTNFDPGGFAEFIRVPKINVEKGVYLLPSNVSFEQATFIEPLACVIRGQKLAGIKKGDVVLVIGSGISGLLHVMLAKMHGAKVFAVDIHDYRIKMARKFGADYALDANENIPAKLMVLNGKLADHVIVCAGALSAAKQALQCVNRGGTILFFAVPEPGINIDVPINDFWRNEVKIMTSYGAGPGDLKESLKLIGERSIEVNEMITHRLSLDETGLGFRLVAESGESIKVIIEPFR